MIVPAILNLVLILSLVFLIRSCFYEPFRNSSGSMLPTIESGDFLVARKFGYGSYGTFGKLLWNTEPSVPIKRGQLLVFRFPPDPSVDYIKRVVGLPGDHIEIKAGKLFINGGLINVERGSSADRSDRFFQVLDGHQFEIIPSPDSARFTDLQVDVPAKHLFVMGDNRPNSNDSRFWGFVPTGNVVGQIEFIF